MCSLAGGDLDYDPSEDISDSISEVSIDTNSSDSTSCRKCNAEEASIVLRGKDRYCRKCFTINVTHKFRSSLGKRRMMRHNDVVGIDFDGCQNSIAVVRLINSSLNEDNVKRILYTPVLIVVYEPFNIPKVDRIIEIASKFGHKVYLVGLHEGLDESSIKPVRVDDLEDNGEEKQNLLLNFSSVEDFCKKQVDGELYQEFRMNLESVKEPTAKTYFTSKIRQQVITSSAKVLGCTKVFSNESASDIAVKIISGVSTGRGQNLVFDAGFQDVSGPIEVLRPLKDFSKEELSFYNQDFENIENGPEPEENNIYCLTKDFIESLQGGFSATIPTVCRTGDKLSGGQNQVDLKWCVFCKGILDTFSPNEGYNALSATDLSRSLSNKHQSSVPSCKKEDSECCSGGDNGCCSSSKRQLEDITFEQAKAHLCYSCRIVVGKMAHIPKTIAQRIRENVNRGKMMDEIKDFLL